MSTPPGAPILNIKPRCTYDSMRFYWFDPKSTGINAFSPWEIPSLSFWIDGNDSSTLTINNHYISQVRDKVRGVVLSLKGNKLGNFLMAQTNTLNNKQSIWFNNQYGNNVYIEGSYNIPIVGSAFFVYTAREQFTQSWRAIFGSNMDNTPRYTYLNGRYNIVGPGITYNDFPGTPILNVVPGNSYMIYYSWNGSKTHVGVFGYPPVEGQNPETIRTSPNIIRIARDVKDYANMNLAEILFFSSELTTIQRQNMEGYLAWKWGLNHLLPPDHPYIDTDPSNGPAKLTGFTLFCSSFSLWPSIPFVSTYAPTVHNTFLIDPNLQRATDYIFGITASNMHGTGPPAYFMISQIGLIPAGVYNAEGTVLNISTVNMTWDFRYTYPEAITKWFIIKAVPSVYGYSTILQQAQNTERARTITNLTSQIHTIIVQAENNVGYSYAEPQNTVTIAVNVSIGSLYFDGINSQLLFSGIKIGLYPYTIEGWFKLSTDPIQRNTIFGGKYTTPGNGEMSVSIIDSTTISVDCLGIAENIYTVPPINPLTWYHFAVCRDLSGNETVFINGIRSSTGIIQNTNNYQLIRYIGAWDPNGLGPTDYFQGNLSELRIVIISKAYDPTLSTITIPPQPLANIFNTKFLLYTPFSQDYLAESGPYNYIFTNTNVVSSEEHA